MGVVGELGNFFNVRGGTGKSLEDLTDVSTLLHGDDSELILFVDPHEESLGVIKEDTSARWPVTVKTASCKVLVSLPNIKRNGTLVSLFKSINFAAGYLKVIPENSVY